MPTVTMVPTSNEVETTGWTNPNNAHANDGVYATASPASKNSNIATRYFNFGFDGQIPPGARITGVRVNVEYKVDTTASIATMRVRARINGVDEENHDHSTEPTSDTLVQFDLTPDRSWVRADLLDAVFKVTADAVRGNDADAVTFSMDRIEVEVDYRVENELFNSGRTICIPIRI